MKKNAMRFFGVAVCMTALVSLNLSMNSGKAASDVSLVDLATSVDANAECPQSPFNNGRCGITGNCYWNWPDYQECDSNGSWGGY